MTTSQTLAVNAGTAAAKVALQSERDSIPGTFRKMLNGRSIVSEIARGVMPVIAETWGVPYRPEQLRVVSDKSVIANQQGIFTADDPKTDAVVVFTVDRVELGEKPSLVLGAFVAMATLGFNDKDVAPEVRATVSVYKRDAADNKLKLTWEGRCIGPRLSMPVTRRFSEIKASPADSKEMFDGAVQATIDSCRRTLTRLSS